MAKTGALQPRVVEPAAALVAAREGVERLLAAWDDGLYERLAAPNLSLDKPQPERKKELDGLRAAHGACRPDGSIEAENALRGEWWLACERGRLRVGLTLAPTQPPRVQELRTVSTLPLSSALAAAAAWGSCRVGATREGGGDSATLRLVCDKGQLDARLEAHPAGGLKSASLAPSEDAACVP